MTDVRHILANATDSYFGNVPPLIELGNTAQRTAADVELLDSLSDRDLIAFRNHIHSPAYICAHANSFRDRDWVDMSELRLFLREQTIMLESPLKSAILIG
ncbi:hypothetical protein DFH09DRAFT_1340632 [Mycena vulgaris]|nr:hypothetical protein DFH09DRAFT_1340632 [Mycena vulgaris]